VCDARVYVYVLPGAFGAGTLTSRMKLSARPCSACMTSQPGACGAGTSSLAMLAVRVLNDEVVRPRMCDGVHKSSGAYGAGTQDFAH